MDPAYRTATDLAAALRRRELGSRELLTHYLDRIDRLNPLVNAVVTIDEGAVARATLADAALARGEVWGPLHGLPVTVKDTLETAGVRTTAGAAEYAAHVPSVDADAVARLRAAGAVVFGKTNTPAYAADCQTYNDLFGTTRNPWNPDRAVGGSSGGSATAVAAGLTALDIGSDLGGSIRFPAGYCGVFGLRPSFGIIPTRGHIPGPPGCLSELDLGTVGPLARGAADLGLALDVLAGPAAADAVAWRLDLRAAPDRPYRYAAWLDDEHCPVDADVLRVLRAAVDALPGVVPAQPCPLREAERLAQRLVQAGMSPAYPDAAYAALRRRAESTDDSPRVRHARNVTASVRDHVIGLEEKARLAARCAAFFADHDVLLCPVTPVTAIPHDHNPDVDARRILVDGVPRPYGDQIPWASLATLCGLPAAVVPVGFAPDGLPVGLQVVGPRFGDRTVIDAAARIAALTGGYAVPPVPAAQVG